MRLKKLEIYGFKSFADRVEMSFDVGITGVVGPNGSGKSNISDAVRWVLGEQSAKTLRGGKMEDVIFGGTEKRKKLAWCEVILTFDNEDRALPIDFYEVAVMRRVYRNGDSEYMINRNGCRLRDIVDLFRDTGIGKEGYSLIGQGRIDEILSVKSEERRQVFEEAAGIVKFKTRKNEAEKRLENTSANLARVQDIISELEARLEPLKAQSASAREYLQLRDELKGLELNVFLLRSERYEARIKELRETLEALNEAVAQSEARETQETGSREKTQEELNELEQQAAGTRELVQKLIQEVEAREGAAGVLRERIAAAEREKNRILSLLADAGEGEDGMKQRITDTRLRLESETQEAEEAKFRLTAMEDALTALNDELVRREQAAEQLKAQMIDAINRLSDVKSERSRLRAMEDALTNRLNSLAGEDETGGEQLIHLEEDAQLAETGLNEARTEKEKLDKQLQETQQALSLSSSEADKLASEHRSALSRRQETASRLKVLEEMQRDYEGYQHSVKQVLMQAKRLPSSGVHGVVANLIQVPRELERAIDMVLGAALQNIVVDREEDAKRMIDYLRNNRLGRATFLPLTSVRGRTLSRDEREALKLDGCVGLASELITFDPKYQGIVDSLLGRTVVARDLDSGIRIQRAGRHAFRLVTLEGDVMHSGGSMTGGSVQSRVTSLLSREREIAEHRERMTTLDETLANLNESIRKTEEKRAALKQVRSDLFDKVHEQEIACAREEAHLASAREALEAQKDRLSRSQSEADRMRSQLDDVRSAIERLQGRQEGEEKTEANHQAEIRRLNGEITELRDELAQKRKVVTDEHIVQAARERGLTALTADLQRMTGEHQDLARQKEDNEAALKAVEETIFSDQAQLKEETDLLSDCRGQLAEARLSFEKIDRSRTGAQQQLKAIAESLDRLRSDLDSFVERQHKAEMQLSRVEAEFKQMTDRIWEDYELTYAGAQEFREEGFKLTESERRISDIRQRIRSLGSVNVGAVDEYRQTLERFEELSAQRDDLTKAQVDLSSIIEDLMKKMEVQFRTQFDALNRNFQETFVNLFGGGRAELQLSDPKDVLNCSIEVVAQPPGKKLQMLSLLSGGERALTAIAILFAMLKLKPTPFCFLDEIEAALDDANIDNFAEYLRTYSRNTQFVVVTHRKGTMERCDALYGVAMEEKGISKMVSVKMSEAIAME